MTSGSRPAPDAVGRGCRSAPTGLKAPTMTPRSKTIAFLVVLALAALGMYAATILKYGNF
jgi:hypothetical protein